MKDTGIIFDLDGTLWDSSAQVVVSWNQVLDSYPDFGKHVTEADMRRFMGNTIDRIGEMMLPEVAEKERARIMRECCEEERVYLREHGGVLYPRLEETLNKLMEDYGLFIVSNSQDGYVQVFLEHHRLGKYFADYEMSGRTGQSKGDNIRLIMERNHLAKAVYVGDTAGDRQAAAQAGVPFIHAKYGFGDLPHERYAIKSIAQIAECVKEVFDASDRGEK